MAIRFDQERDTYLRLGVVGWGGAGGDLGHGDGSPDREGRTLHSPFYYPQILGCYCVELHELRRIVERMDWSCASDPPCM
jgi:hypothetical protein